MLWLIAPAVLLAVIIWYALSGRATLKTKPWARGFLSKIEPAEILLYRKSETLLIGRLLWAGGLVVTSYDTLAVFVQGLDLTPLTSRFLANVPPDLRGLVISGIVFGLGLMINQLRKRQTQPLELVEIADKDVTPRIAEALALADSTKTEAVAVVHAVINQGVA